MPNKQSRLDRAAASLSDSIQRTIALFSKGGTWGVLGLLAVVILIIWVGTKYALQTDNLLHFIHYSGASCREPSDAGIFFMFCGALFFALATVAMFGEITVYLRMRNTSAFRQTKQALIGALSWGGFSFGLGLAIIFYLGSLCR